MRAPRQTRFTLLLGTRSDRVLRSLADACKSSEAVVSDAPWRTPADRTKHNLTRAATAHGKKQHAQTGSRRVERAGSDVIRPSQSGRLGAAPAGQAFETR